MKETFEVTCGPIVAGGTSLVRRPGHKTLFVEGGLPDEVANVVVVEDQPSLQRAQLIEIKEPSPHRVQTPCAMVERGCGGCQWQHIDPGFQAELKVHIVRDSLRRIAKLPDPPVRLAGSISSTEYRTSLRLAVSSGRAAMRRLHRRELVAIDSCLVAHPLIDALVREGDFGEATEVTLRAGIATGSRLALVQGDATGVRLPDDVLLADDRTTASMNEASMSGVAINEDVAGRRYRISAHSFFQSGPAAAELLAATVDAAIPQDVTWILDAYAGVGVLGGTAASTRHARLTAIEQDPWAVSDARHNLKDLDAEVRQCEVASIELLGSIGPDVIIADPARSGVGRGAMRVLTAMNCPRIILVSCDPASLARDVNLAVGAGYTLTAVEVLDLFPHTHHVETISIFDHL